MTEQENWWKESFGPGRWCPECYAEAAILEGHVVPYTPQPGERCAACKKVAK